MVQGLAFLSKKGFNPQNQSNQKRVWEAEQAAKNEKERLRKRQEQLQREQEEEELERVTKGDIGGSQAQLRFMYDAPPGLNKDNKQEDKQDDKKPAAAVSNESASSSTLDQLARANTGDDAAAEAFRRMLASSVQNENDGKDHDDDDEGQNDAEPSFRFAPVLQGTTVDGQGGAAGGGDGNKGKGGTFDGRSALEKAVGRKDRSTQNLSYQQQIERFPQLKNAPMVHSMKKATGGDEQKSEQPMMVNFKPLGAQILHVRCLACGIWGHQRGDRECAKSGWNPFALPSQSSTAATSVAQGSSSILPDSKALDKSRPAKAGNGEHSRRERRSRDRSYDSESSHERRKRRRHRHKSRKHRRSKHDDSSRSCDDSSDSDQSNNKSTPSSEDSRNLKRRRDPDNSDKGDGDQSYRDRKHRHKSSKKRRHKHEHTEDSSRRRKKKHKRSRRSDSE
jgi:CBF1 interacting corepressor